MSDNKENKKDLYKDLQLEFRELQAKYSDLEIVAQRLKEVVIKNDLTEELSDIDFISVEERLCVNGINHISELVRNHQYDDKDVKNFDTLFKALRIIKGYSVPETNGKKNKTSVKDLLKIVEGK